MRQRLPFVILQILSLCSSAIIDPPPDPIIDPPPDPIRPSPQDLLWPNPRRNITCLGDRSDYGYAQDYGNGRSMQQLCTNPLYGGSDTAPNFQGYCNEGDVFFRRYSGLDIPETQGDDARKLLECRNPCFCYFGLPDPQQQSRTVALTRKTFNVGSLNSARLVDLDYREERVISGRLMTRIYYRMTSSSDETR